jgi:peptidoglycan/LPS O-acetylase OafA/YrhL
VPVDPEASENKRTPRFLELLGARGLLAFGVVIYHTGFDPVYWLILFMDCFFVLSAFLITLGLIEWNHPETGTRMKRFFVRRMARIVPGYYVLLGGVAMLLIAINLFSDDLGIRSYSLTQLVPYVFYVQFVELYGTTDEILVWQQTLRFLMHTWSLAVEEQFYLVWGVLFFLAHRPWMRVAVGAGFVVIGIAARASELVASPLLLYRLDAFGYGILMALAFHHLLAGEANHALRLRLSRASMVLCAACLVLFLHFGGIWDNYRLWLLQDQPLEVSLWNASSIVSSVACASMLAAVILAPGSMWSAWLRTPISLYLGRISYALYLVHFPILDVLLHINTPILPFDRPINIGIAFCLALLSAHLLTLFMEWAQRAIIRRVDPSRQSEADPPTPARAT